MGELRDAAFASCWGSAAMETKQIWTWVCSCSIIYCVDCFIFKSGWGQGISIFFSNSLNFLFTVLFSVFFFFFFFNFQYSHMSLAVLVLEMFLDVLYFHSCGIVGIMMVMVKLAHPLLFMNCMLNVSFGFRTAFWREDSIHELQMRSYDMWECCGLSSFNTLNALCKEKKKKRSPFNNTACDWAFMIL